MSKTSADILPLTGETKPAPSVWKRLRDWLAKDPYDGASQGNIEERGTIG